VHVSAIVSGEVTLLNDINNNEQLFINLATVMGRRKSIIPPAQSCGRNTPIYFFEIQWTLLGFFCCAKTKKNRRITTVFAKNGLTIVTCTSAKWRLWFRLTINNLALVFNIKLLNL